MQTSSRIHNEVAYRGLQPQNKSLAASVACLNNMPLTEYLRYHTLMAIHLPTRDSQMSNGNSSWSPRELKILGMANLRSDALFCEKCVRDDEEKFGYSYWRRSHQIPGVHWCGNHNNYPLTHVCAETAFLELPRSWISHEASSPGTAYFSGISSNGLKNLIALQEALVDTGEVFDSAIVNASLQYQASLNGIDTSRQGKSKLLSEVALENFSIEFLAEYFQVPYFFGINTHFSSKIDDIFRHSLQKPSSKSMILAASLLFTSVDQVFKSWRIHTPKCRFKKLRPESSIQE